MNNIKGGQKKSLVVTTVASTLDQFCMNDIAILQNDYKVHVAANFSLGNNTSKERVEEFKLELEKKKIIYNEVDFNRKPISRSNYIAYKEMRQIINNNFFDIIHCHTPIAALIVRIAARRAREKGTKVIYTAHGLHFFKGASLKNWIIFYPIEWCLARYTDVLITINKEDYSIAKKSLKAGEIEYIPGIGIDTDKFSNIYVNKAEKRKELGLSESSFVILSVGELNRNKNHETIIKAIATLKNPNINYVICGQGELEVFLIKLIQELNLEKQIMLLGYRRDIAEICKAVDAFAFPSYREGLSVALMEAMALGLPVVCSNIRGNIDLIEDGKGGLLLKPDDVQKFSEAIDLLFRNENLRKKFGIYNLENIKKFDIKNVMKEMKTIYSKFL